MSTGSKIPDIDHIVPLLDRDMNDLRMAMNSYLHHRERLLSLREDYADRHPEKFELLWKELLTKKRHLRSHLKAMYDDLEEKF